MALMHIANLSPDALGLAFSLLTPLAASLDPNHTTTANNSSSRAPPPAAAAPTPSSSTASSSQVQQLLSHCRDQLLQQFGDMEANMRCRERRSSLHSLPLPALLALLQDERTCAASENTVLAAVHSWMGAAAQQGAAVDAEQRQQLAAAVRLPLLEPCYLATVLPRMGWLLEILGLQGLAMVAGAARGCCDPHAGEPGGCSVVCAGVDIAVCSRRCRVFSRRRVMSAQVQRAQFGGVVCAEAWCCAGMHVQA